MRRLAGRGLGLSLSVALVLGLVGGVVSQSEHNAALATPAASLHMLPVQHELFTPNEVETTLNFSSKQGQIWKRTLEEALQLAGVPHTILWSQVLTGSSEEDDEEEDDDSPRAELLQCMNKPGVWGELLDWSGAMYDRSLGNFAMVAAWSHRELASGPKFPLTVTTTASVSRTPQLYAQCLSWPGPLSAVMYQPLLQESGVKGLSAHNRAVLRGAVQKISQFMADMRTVPEACQPDVMLVYEMFTDDLSRRILYPFNTLRNAARLQARTPLVAMVDVDLLISKSLHERVADPRRLEQMMQQVANKAVYIIPALDVHGGHEKAAWAQALVSTTKDMVVLAMQKGIAFQFASEKYPPGHNLTDFPKWQVTNEDYKVDFQPLCEPWIIGDRLALPWADGRFRGYGYDKVQLIEDVAAHGFSFIVMHDAFIIHRAHQQNEARSRFLKYMKPERGEPTLFSHNMGLWQEQTRLHHIGKPSSPELHTTTQHCIDSLSWWQEDEQGEQQTDNKGQRAREKGRKGGSLEDQEI